MYKSLQIVHIKIHTLSRLIDLRIFHHYYNGKVLVNYFNVSGLEDICIHNALMLISNIKEHLQPYWGEILLEIYF